jgi:hypothetical protein
LCCSKTGGDPTSNEVRFTQFKPCQTGSVTDLSAALSPLGREYTAHLNPCHFVGMASSCNHALPQGLMRTAFASRRLTHNNMLWPASSPTDKLTGCSGPDWPGPACQNQASPDQTKQPLTHNCRGAHHAAPRRHINHPPHMQATHMPWACVSHCQASKPMADNAAAPTPHTRPQAKRPTGKTTGGALYMAGR